MATGAINEARTAESDSCSFSPESAAALNTTAVSGTAKDRDYGMLHTPANPNKSLKARRSFRIFLIPSLVLTTMTV